MLLDMMHQQKTRHAVIGITMSRANTEHNWVYFILFAIINIFLVTETEITENVGWAFIPF